MKYLLKIYQNDIKTLKVFDVENPNDIEQHIPENCSFSINSLVQLIQSVKNTIEYRKQSLKSIQDEIDMYQMELQELQDLNK